MSANDIIYIKKQTHEVYYQGCADNEDLGEKIGKGRHTDDAIDIATKYAEESCAYGYPEYGIKFI
jgi:hypothetical protein